MRRGIAGARARQRP